MTKIVDLGAAEVTADVLCSVHDSDTADAAAETIIGLVDEVRRQETRYKGHTEILIRERDEARRQLAIAREALEKYADPTNWTYITEHGNSMLHGPAAGITWGHEALAKLGGEP